MMMVVCLRTLLAQLMERPTLWTHIFSLMFYRDLSSAMMMFLLHHLWIRLFFSIRLSLVIVALYLHSTHPLHRYLI